MGKWRFPESRYHDPVRAELIDGSEVLSPEEVLKRYRSHASQQAARYVEDVLAPLFPKECAALQTVIERAINILPAVPLRAEARTTYAREIAAHWLSIIKIEPEHESELERGIADFILAPKRRRKRRRLPLA